MQKKTPFNLWENSLEGFRQRTAHIMSDRASSKLVLLA